MSRIHVMKSVTYIFGRRRMEKIKAGIFGFGRMAENHHMKLMNESGLYDIAGVCDITESRRTSAGKLGLKTTESLEEMLSWDIELVVISTHSSAHHEAALKVAAAGKHMLVEKPMCVTVKEAEEMVKAAEEAGVCMMVYHNRHNDADIIRVRGAVAEGLAGEIVSIENRTMGSRPALGFGIPDYNPNWRVTASDGGGTLMDFGPHWVEQVLSLMGHHKVVSVFADIRHVKWGDADDLFDIMMVFDNGVRARAAKSDISFWSPSFKLVVIGTEATICARGSGCEESIVKGPDFETVRKEQIDIPSLHVNLAKHLRGEEELMISPGHALRVMKVLGAARESAQSASSISTEI